MVQIGSLQVPTRFLNREGIMFFRPTVRRRKATAEAKPTKKKAAPKKKATKKKAAKKK